MDDRRIFLTFIEAVFLIKIHNKFFLGQPRIYIDYMLLMREFNSSRIDTATAKNEIARLFMGHQSNLLRGIVN